MAGESRNRPSLKLYSFAIDLVVSNVTSLCSQTLKIGDGCGVAWLLWTLARRRC